jgi:hypothetical protein
MWAVSRRTGLFIVSYAPLAAMFVVLKWPVGWSAGELGALAAWLTSLAALLLLLPSAIVATTVAARAVVAAATLAAAAIVIAGLSSGWTDPMALSADKPHTAGTASGLAFGFCVLALLIVFLLLYNASRAATIAWTVADPHDQGGAVAGYLATYLLPLLSSGAGGWRITAAYGIYLATVYIVFVRSESLVLINPTLYLFRYRIYDVEVVPEAGGQRRRVLLLSRLQITTETEVSVVPLGDQTYVGKSRPAA